MASEDDSRIYVPDVRHSPLGPSGADRWMHCKGSPNLIRKLDPAIQSTAYAEEGQAAHAVLARCLATGEEPWMCAGKIVVIGKNEYVVDEEVVEGVQLALDRIREIRTEYPNGILYIESEVSSALDPEAFGQADIRYEVPGVAIFIWDFKFGQGVPVEPTKPQMRIYGYMSYEGRGPEMRGDGNEPTKIICGVIQPRIPHPNGLIREVSYDVAETEEWFAVEVLGAMEETRDPLAPLCVGEWCQFCPVKKANKCPAIFKQVAELPLSLEPQTLTDDELGDLLAKFEILSTVKTRCEEDAFRRALTGASVKNRKLVRKKANREFRKQIEEDMRDAAGEVMKDETGEVKRVLILLDDAMTLQFGLDRFNPPTSKTPAQLESLPMGKEFVARWAFKPDAGLTLAPITDSRAAVRPLMDRMDEKPLVVEGAVI